MCVERVIVPSKYYREETRELNRQIKAKALMKQRLEDHIAYHIERNPVEAEKKMWEDWNKLSDEDRRVIRERIEKSLAFCTAQLEEDGKTCISDNS